MHSPRTDYQSRRRRPPRQGHLSRQESAVGHLQSIPEESSNEGLPVAMGEPAPVSEDINVSPVTIIPPAQTASANVQCCDASLNIQRQHTSRHVQGQHTSRYFQRQPTNPNIQSQHTPQNVQLQHTHRSVQSQHTPQNVQLQHTRRIVQSQHTPQNVQLQHTHRSVQSQHTSQNVLIQHTRQSVQYQHTPQNVQLQHTRQSVQYQHTPQNVQLQHTHRSVQSHHTSQNVQLQHTHRSVQSLHTPQNVQLQRTRRSVRPYSTPQNIPLQLTSQHTSQNIQLQLAPQNIQHPLNHQMFYVNPHQYFPHPIFGNLNPYPAIAFQLAFPLYQFSPGPIAWPMMSLTSQRHPIEFNQPLALFHHDTTPYLEFLAAGGDLQEFLRQQYDDYRHGRQIGMQEQSIQKVLHWLLTSCHGDDQFPESVRVEEEEIHSSSTLQADQETKKLDTSVPTQNGQENVQKTCLTSDEGNRLTETQGAKPKYKNIKQKHKTGKHALEFGDDQTDVMCPFGRLPVQACNWLGDPIARTGHVLRYHYGDVEYGDCVELAPNTAGILIAYDEMFLCYTFIHPTENILYYVAQYVSASNTHKEHFYYSCEIFSSETFYFSEKNEMTSMDETTFGALVSSDNIPKFESEIVSTFVAEETVVLFIIIPSFLRPILSADA